MASSHNVDVIELADIRSNRGPDTSSRLDDSGDDEGKVFFINLIKICILILTFNCF